MTVPVGVRRAARLRQRLHRLAAERGERPMPLATRLVDEGLRMLEFPGIAFRDSAASGRVPTLMRGPEVAAVIRVLTDLETTGEARITETAAWFDIHPAEVRLALAYYDAFRPDIDERIALQERSAAVELARWESERTRRT